MPAIIPIPAFTDNTIGLVRGGARAAAEARAGRKLASAAEGFAVVRAWKNGFR